MNVWVKVVGFSTEERHAIQTMLRLSQESSIRFKWWVPTCGLAPNLLLLDTESHEAELEVQSPSFNPFTKSIVVGGALSVPGTWRQIERPLDWRQMLREFETLFVSAEIDLLLHEPGSSKEHPGTESIPPGFKTGLIVGLSREEQFYLKARLALQGIAHVEEVDDATQAAEQMGSHRYDMVIVAYPLPDVDARSFIQVLLERREAPMEVVVVLTEPAWKETLDMESTGIRGVLETPFLPHQVGELISQL